jgi:hypothetical protein
MKNHLILAAVSTLATGKPAPQSSPTPVGSAQINDFQKLLNAQVVQ